LGFGHSVGFEVVHLACSRWVTGGGGSAPSFGGEQSCEAGGFWTGFPGFTGWVDCLLIILFVKRTTGQLPAGAWVGTVSKVGGEVAAISSKHFFGYQLPAPPEVWEAVRRRFE